MMCLIKWDEKYFETSGLYIWIYSRGFLVSTNENHYGTKLAVIYSKKNESINNNKTEREIK